MLCLQWVAGTAAAPSHALLEGAPERQQTSMPSGSGLLPGPTLRALRARWDHWALGWLGPVVVCLVLADALMGREGWHSLGGDF